MGRAVHFKPAIFSNFPFEDLVMHTVVEDFRPAAGHAA